MPIASKTDAKAVTSAVLAAALMLSVTVYFASAADGRNPSADPITAAETGVGAGAGRYAAGTEAPETDAPDTASDNETAAPETDKAAQPETEKPETTKKETAAPETTKPETTKPETTKKETTAPETTKPETTKPETTKKETEAPAPAVPASSAPAAGAAKVSTTYTGTISSATLNHIDVRIEYTVVIKEGETSATVAADAYLDFLNLKVNDPRKGNLVIGSTKKAYSTGAISETDRNSHSLLLASNRVSVPLSDGTIKLSAEWNLGGRYAGHYLGNIVAEGYVTLTDGYETMPNSAGLDVKNILQTPELPNGCEVTSLAIVLNYLGFNADKVSLSDNLLAKKVPYTDANPAKENAGNPRDAVKSYGCWAPVIRDTAVKYLSNIVSTGSSAKYDPRDLTGTHPRELYRLVSLGIPVIVWVTNPIDDAPYLMNSWTAKDGALINWKHPSHTVVLTGYDLSGKTVTLSDPLQGTVKVSAEIFETRYAQMGSQAVAILAG